MVFPVPIVPQPILAGNIAGVLAAQGGVRDRERALAQGGEAPVVEAAVGQGEGAQEVPYMSILPMSA